MPSERNYSSCIRLRKSVSRYARNIGDCISYIRKLKALGIGIYFEEQNINSLTEDSEVYIGIYGVMAQNCSTIWNTHRKPAV